MDATFGDRLEDEGGDTEGGGIGGGVHMLMKFYEFLRIKSITKWFGKKTDSERTWMILDMQN